MADKKEEKKKKKSSNGPMFKSSSGLVGQNWPAGQVFNFPTDVDQRPTEPQKADCSATYL